MKDFGSRLKQLAKNKFGSVGNLAIAVKISQPQLSNYIREMNKPGLDFFEKLANLGCDINYLLGGHSISEYSGANYRVEAVVPAGVGGLNFTDWEQQDHVYFPPDKHFLVIIDTSNGDSMIPLINPSDKILVSLHDRVKIGDIVLARWGKNDGAVKLLSQVVDDHIILTSYNPTIKPILTNLKETKIYKVVQIIKQ